MKFSVATNFQPDLLDALEGYPVSELFGKLPSDSVGGGRASFMLSPLSAGRFREHVQDAAQRGIGFNYLVNPACLDNREYTRRGQAGLERLLGFVEDCGVTAVTVSLPFLMPIIKRRHPGLKVRVGVYARVDCVAKARFWEDLGADCITLESIAVNRDFDMLKAIRRAVRLELQLPDLLPAVGTAHGEPVARLAKGACEPRLHDRLLRAQMFLGKALRPVQLSPLRVYQAGGSQDLHRHGVYLLQDTGARRSHRSAGAEG